MAPSGPRARIQANIKALETAASIVIDGAPLTAEAQQEIGEYGGWGPAAAIFAPGASGNDLRDQKRLRAVMNKLGGSPETGERLFNAAALTIINAYYTDPVLVTAIYRALGELGLTEGSVIEPGVGAAGFAAFAPDGIRVTGIELDPSTALIAQLLQPQAEILTGSVSFPRFVRVRDQKADPVRVPRDYADGFVGNVPFGDVKWPDDVLNPDEAFAIHDHAIRWGVTRVAPGGVCGFITSRYTADKKNPEFRRVLAADFDLLGMVRLPDTAHKRMAGTRVVTDIIIGRRLGDGERPVTDPESWEQSRNLVIPGTSETARINRYFHDNPQHILGELQTGGMYREDNFTVAPTGNLEEQLGAALSEITGRALALGQRHSPQAGARPVIEVLSRRPDGTITAHPDGSFTQVVRERDVPLKFTSASDEDKTRKLVTIAETLADLRRLEGSCPEDTEEIDETRARLSRAYDAYAVRYGPIGKFTVSISHPKVKPVETVLERLDFSRKDISDPEVSRLEAYLGRHALETIISSVTDPANPKLVRHSTRKDKHGNKVTTTRQLVELSRVRAALEAALARIPEGPDRESLTATFTGRMARMETVEQRRRLMPAAFRTDPRRPAVEALETFNPVTQTAVKKPVFSRRTAVPPRTRLGADTPEEALDLVLIHRGRVDLGEIARLLGTGETEARDMLGTLVFDNPETGRLDAAGDYLSGNVVDKLAAAREAAERDPERYSVNVEQLEAAQPPPVAAEDIQARLGSSWLSHDIVQEGLRHILNDPHLKVIHPGGAQWKVTSRLDYHSRPSDKYGTSDWTSIALAQALLTNEPITVRRTYIDESGKEKSYRDDTATSYAFRRAQRLDADFTTWLWSDPDRADKCAHLYNNAYNNHVKRKWDSAPFYIPGLAPGIKPHPFQNAAARRYHTENGLAAWVVGAGKTNLGLTAAMEGYRLGRHKLAGIITPAGLIAQWRDAAYRVFPQARVLVADDDLRSGKDARARFIERASSGDYQLALVPYEFFTSLTLSPEAARATLDEEIKKLARYAEQAAAQGDRQTGKDLQNRIARLEAAYSAEVRASGGASGFTDSGIDALVVDEIHNFRRIRRDSKNREFAMPGSTRGNDLLKKFDYLRARHPDGLLLGLTGTPLEQSIADAWAMMRFFEPGLLRRLGLEEFDAFLTTFGRSQLLTEPTPTGSGKRLRERHADWFNLTEMRTTLWDPFVDVIRSNDLSMDLPRLAGGRPQIHVLPMTPAQLAKQAEIDADYEKFKHGAREEYPIFSLMDQAQKLSLHPAMLGMEGDGRLKVEEFADHLAAWYRRAKDARFLDRDGNPHPQPGALAMVACELGVPDPARPGAWSVYSDLRSLLADRGVPTDVIRFAQDADSDRKKAALWEDARTGYCNIVIGSAQTAGTGVDVPDRLQELHYLNLSWNPTQFEQWMGRIIRQGNQNPEVSVHVWTTEGSIDAFRASKIETKSRPFEALLDDKSRVRRVTEDADTPLSAFAAEMTARTSGDPLLNAKQEAQLRVETVEGMQDEWQRGNTRRARQIRELQNRVKDLEEENTVIDGILARAADTTGDKFQALISGVLYTARGDAGTALITDLSATAAGDLKAFAKGAPQYLGELAGFPVAARYSRVKSLRWPEPDDAQPPGDVPAPEPEVTYRTLVAVGLEDVIDGQIAMIDAEELPDRDPPRLITSLENRIRRLPGRKERNITSIAEANDEIAKGKTELAKPSPYLDELAEARDALDRIEDQISEQLKTDAPAGIARETEGTGAPETADDTRGAAAGTGAGPAAGSTAGKPGSGRATQPGGQGVHDDPDQVPPSPEELTALAGKLGLRVSSSTYSTVVSKQGKTQIVDILTLIHPDGPLQNTPGRRIPPAAVPAYLTAAAQSPSAGEHDAWYAASVPGAAEGERAFSRRTVHHAAADAAERASETQRDQYMYTDDLAAVCAPEPPASGAAYYRVTPAGDWHLHMNGEVSGVPRPSRGNDLSVIASERAAAPASSPPGAAAPVPDGRIVPLPPWTISHPCSAAISAMHAEAAASSSLMQEAARGDRDGFMRVITDWTLSYLAGPGHVGDRDAADLSIAMAHDPVFAEDPACTIGVALRASAGAEPAGPDDLIPPEVTRAAMGHWQEAGEVHGRMTPANVLDLTHAAEIDIWLSRMGAHRAGRRIYLDYRGQAAVELTAADGERWQMHVPQRDAPPGLHARYMITRSGHDGWKSYPRITRAESAPRQVALMLAAVLSENDAAVPGLPPVQLQDIAEPDPAAGQEALPTREADEAWIAAHPHADTITRLIAAAEDSGQVAAWASANSPEPFFQVLAEWADGTVAGLIADDDEVPEFAAEFLNGGNPVFRAAVIATAARRVYERAGSRSAPAGTFMALAARDAVTRIEERDRSGAGKPACGCPTSWNPGTGRDRPAEAVLTGMHLAFAGTPARRFGVTWDVNASRWAVCLHPGTGGPYKILIPSGQHGTGTAWQLKGPGAAPGEITGTSPDAAAALLLAEAGRISQPETSQPPAAAAEEIPAASPDPAPPGEPDDDAVAGLLAAVPLGGYDSDDQRAPGLHAVRRAWENLRSRARYRQPEALTAAVEAAFTKDTFRTAELFTSIADEASRYGRGPDAAGEDGYPVRLAASALARAATAYSARLAAGAASPVDPLPGTDTAPPDSGPLGLNPPGYRDSDDYASGRKAAHSALARYEADPDRLPGIPSAIPGADRDSWAPIARAAVTALSAGAPDPSGALRDLAAAAGLHDARMHAARNSSRRTMTPYDDALSYYDGVAAVTLAWQHWKRTRTYDAVAARSRVRDIDASVTALTAGDVPGASAAGSLMERDSDAAAAACAFLPTVLSDVQYLDDHDVLGRLVAAAADHAARVRAARIAGTIDGIASDLADKDRHWLNDVAVLGARHGMKTRTGWNGELEVRLPEPAWRTALYQQEPGGPMMTSTGRPVPDPDAYLTAIADAVAKHGPDGFRSIEADQVYAQSAGNQEDTSGERSFSSEDSAQARQTAQARMEAARSPQYIYGHGRALVVTSRRPDGPCYAVSPGSGWTAENGAFPLDGKAPAPVHLTALLAPAPPVRASQDEGQEPATESAGPAAVSRIVIEHGEYRTTIRGADHRSTTIRAILKDAGFTPHREHGIWYLTRRTSKSSRDWKVASVKRAFDRENIPYDEADSPLPYGAGDAPVLPDAAPYPGLSAATVGYGKIQAAYSGILAYRNQPRHWTRTRSDVRALMAAVDALGHFSRYGPPAGVAGDLDATWQHLAGLTADIAESAWVLHANLAEQRIRAPKWMPLLETLVKTSAREAARMAATAPAAPDSAADGPDPAARLADDNAAEDTAAAGTEEAAHPGSPATPNPPPEDTAAQAPSPTRDDDQPGPAAEQAPPGADQSQAPGDAGTVTTLLRDLAKKHELSVSVRQRVATGDDIPSPPVVPARDQETTIIEIADGDVPVLRHNTFAGRTTVAGMAQIDLGEADAYLTARKAYPGLPSLALLDWIRSGPDETAQLTLSAARTVAGKHGLTADPVRAAGQPFIVFREPGCDRAVLAYSPGSTSASTGLVTVPVPAISAYLHHYRIVVPQDRIEALARNDSEHKNWMSQVSALAPCAIGEPPWSSRSAWYSIRRARIKAEKGDDNGVSDELKQAWDSGAPFAPAPDRQAVLVRLIRDVAGRYHEITGDGGRYVAEISKAIRPEWNWIDQWIRDHPEVLTMSLTDEARTQRDEDERTHAESEGQRLADAARDAFEAGDRKAALALLDQAELADPGLPRWERIRGIILEAGEATRTGSREATGQQTPGQDRPVEDGLPATADGTGAGTATRASAGTSEIADGPSTPASTASPGAASAPGTADTPAQPRRDRRSADGKPTSAVAVRDSASRDANAAVPAGIRPYAAQFEAMVEAALADPAIAGAAQQDDQRNFQITFSAWSRRYLGALVADAVKDADGDAAAVPDWAREIADNEHVVTALTAAASVRVRKQARMPARPDERLRPSPAGERLAGPVERSAAPGTSSGSSKPGTSYRTGGDNSEASHETTDLSPGKGPAGEEPAPGDSQPAGDTSGAPSAGEPSPVPGGHDAEAPRRLAVVTGGSGHELDTDPPVPQVTVLTGAVSRKTGHRVQVIRPAYDEPVTEVFWVRTGKEGKKSEGSSRVMSQRLIPDLSPSRFPIPGSPAPEKWSKELEVSSVGDLVILYSDGIRHEGTGTEHVGYHVVHFYGPDPDVDAEIRASGAYDQLPPEMRERYDEFVGWPRGIRRYRTRQAEEWNALIQWLTANTRDGALPTWKEASSALSVDRKLYRAACRIVRHYAAAGIDPPPAYTSAGDDAEAADMPDSGPEPGSGTAPEPGLVSPPEVSRLLSQSTAVSSARDAAANLGRVFYVHRAPEEESADQCMVSTAVPPLAAGYLSVTPGGSWTEHWRGRSRPLDATDGVPALDCPLTLTEARALAEAAGLAAVITRVAEKAFVSLVEPGAETAPLLSFEAGSDDRAVFAGRETRTPSQAIEWLNSYREAADSLAPAAGGTIYEAGDGIEDWAQRVAHLVPHMIPARSINPGVVVHDLRTAAMLLSDNRPAAERKLREAEEEAGPLVLSPAREAEFLTKILEDAPRLHDARVPDIAQAVAREAADPAARPTWREEDWIRTYIRDHPDVLTGPYISVSEQLSAAHQQQKADRAEAAALVEQMKRAFDDRDYAEALALLDDAELRAPGTIIRGTSIPAFRAKITRAAEQVPSAARQPEPAAPAPADAAGHAAGSRSPGPGTSGTSGTGTGVTAADPPEDEILPSVQWSRSTEDGSLRGTLDGHPMTVFSRLGRAPHRVLVDRRRIGEHEDEEMAKKLAVRHALRLIRESPDAAEPVAAPAETALAANPVSAPAPTPADGTAQAGSSAAPAPAIADNGQRSLSPPRPGGMVPSAEPAPPATQAPAGGSVASSRRDSAAADTAAAGPAEPGKAKRCSVTHEWILADKVGLTGHLVYRGLCQEHQWEGPWVETENEAVEDACDHGWEGWRDQPLVPGRPRTGTKRAQEKWLAQVTRLYPPGWIEDGGPVRETRQGAATRHHRDTWGGYSIGVLPQQTAVSSPSQPALPDARPASPAPSPDEAGPSDRIPMLIAVAQAAGLRGQPIDDDGGDRIAFIARSFAARIAGDTILPDAPAWRDGYPMPLRICECGTAFKARTSDDGSRIRFYHADDGEAPAGSAPNGPGDDTGDRCPRCLELLADTIVAVDDPGLPPEIRMVASTAAWLRRRGLIEPDHGALDAEIGDTLLLTVLAHPDISNSSDLADLWEAGWRTAWERSLPVWECACGARYKTTEKLYLPARGHTASWPLYADDDGELGECVAEVLLGEQPGKPHEKAELPACPGCGRDFATSISKQLIEARFGSAPRPKASSPGPAVPAGEARPGGRPTPVQASFADPAATLAALPPRDAADLLLGPSKAEAGSQQRYAAEWAQARLTPEMRTVLHKASVLGKKTSAAASAYAGRPSGPVFATFAEGLDSILARGISHVTGAAGGQHPASRPDAGRRSPARGPRKPAGRAAAATAGR